MITLESDLKLSLDELNIKFISMLNGHRDELEMIIDKAVESFDFEKVLTEHVHNIIEDALYKAAQEIDLTDNIKALIWSKIEENINK